MTDANTESQSVESGAHPLDKWLKFAPKGMADNIRNSYDSKTDEERQSAFKKIAIISAVVMIVMAVVLFGESSTDYAEKRKAAAEKPVTKELISSEKINSLADEALAKQINDMQSLMERVSKQQEAQNKKHEMQVDEMKEKELRLREEINQLQKAQSGTELESQISVLKDELKNEIEAVKKEQEMETADIKSQMKDKLGNIFYSTNSDLTATPDPVQAKTEDIGMYDYGVEVAEKSETTSKPVQEEKEEVVREEEQSNTTFLPTTTIMTGILLSGVDAKTNIIGTEDNPQPVVIRLKGNAILPNEFQADVDNCNALATGWGDISTERVYFRTSQLSCIDEAGNVIDVPLEATLKSAVDGKEGLRGRLVSREGKLITKATIAGFVQGVSGAFKPAFQLGGSLQTDADGMMQTPTAGQVGQIGAYGGASNSMSKLADYYVSMIGKMSPILEIRPLQEVNLVLVEGVSLQWSR